MNQRISRRSVLRGVAAGALVGIPATNALAQDGSPVPVAGTPAIESSSGPITIFVAKEIVTQNPDLPEATHVAVREGRVLGAGTLDTLSGWGEYTLDETFKDLILIPGLIEAHNHEIEGLMAFLPYAGYYDRPAVDGGVLKGITSYDDLTAFLKAEDAKLTDPNAPLVAIEFDPIFFWGQPPVDKTFLDQISTTRQVALWYASEHTLMVNTATLTASKITSSATDPGVVMGSDGEPTGELNSPSAMALATDVFGSMYGQLGKPETIQALGKFATNCGCTMVTDLANLSFTSPDVLTMWHDTVSADDFPVRVGLYPEPTLPGSPATPDTAAELFLQMKQTAETDKLRLVGIKLMLDGSIQDLTAYLNWPGYYQATNDLQGPLMTEDEVVEWLTPIQAAGVRVAAHCNGDRTVDVFLNAVERASRTSPVGDLRHTVEHSQMSTAAQYERMAEFGLTANLFANHLWYYGDQHYEITVGPERAEQMEAARTALDAGVTISFHTDASVTPLGCLHSMWCAVNRVTPKGRILGEHEKVSAAEALHAVTLGSAYLLGLDAEMGSIETGKLADFTVLEQNPLDVDPATLKDIPVWGTVVGGVKYPSARTAAAS